MPERRCSAVATGVRHFKASGHELSAIHRLNRNWRTIDNGGFLRIITRPVREQPRGREFTCWIFAWINFLSFAGTRKDSHRESRSWMLSLPKLREQRLFLSFYPASVLLSPLTICVYVARMLNSYSNVGLEPRGFWSMLKYRLCICFFEAQSVFTSLFDTPTWRIQIIGMYRGQWFFFFLVLIISYISRNFANIVRSGHGQELDVANQSFLVRRNRRHCLLVLEC